MINTNYTPILFGYQNLSCYSYYRVTGCSKKENMNLQRQSMKRYFSFFLRRVFLFIAEVSEFLDSSIVGDSASGQELCVKVHTD